MYVTRCLRAILPTLISCGGFSRERVFVADVSGIGDDDA